MVRALLFDLGNVLVPFEYERFFRRLEAHSSLGAEEIGQRFRSSNLLRLYETGAITTPEFYERCCQTLDLQIPFEPFAETWTGVFDTTANFRADFFSELASRYTLVLLSNTNDLHFEFLSRKFPWLATFHGHALSFRVSEKKPGPRIYQAAVKMAGVQPSEAFYTDDIPEYVDAARSEGISQSVVFTNPTQLIQEMTAAGIRMDGLFDPSGGQKR